MAQNLASWNRLCPTVAFIKVVYLFAVGNG